jgi:hypothetical protein
LAEAVLAAGAVVLLELLGLFNSVFDTITSNGGGFGGGGSGYRQMLVVAVALAAAVNGVLVLVVQGILHHLSISR